MTVPSTPLPAATVILARERESALEVLLLRRPYAQKFMGGAWVFPGGKVDPKDGTGADGVRRAAIREVAEEAGVMLSVDDLVVWARWITPAREPVRFDACFFVAEVPASAEVRPDPREVVAAEWLTPVEALARAARGELRVMPPTLRNLEILSSCTSFADVRAAAPREDPEPIEPVLEMQDGVIFIALPGDPLHPVRERRVAGKTRIVLRELGFVSEDP